MDSDELATPGYQVLSPATKIKLATLPIGELMVRHPHFTQPIFVRFPRPAVLRGRDGVERFGPAADLPFDDAVVRQLVRLDRRIRPNQVKDLIAERRPEDVRRALAAVRRERPQDALAYFRRQLGGRVAAAGTAVTVTFDSTALESSSMATGAMQPALDRMRGLKSDLLYDDRMHVVSAAFSGLAGAPSPVTEQMGKNLKGMSFPLPDGPVGVGDSWTAENEVALAEQLGASAPIKSKTTLTVKEIQVAGADTAVLLHVETAFPGEPITLTQQGKRVTMKLSGGLTGEQLYSLSKSAQVHAAIGGTMRIKVKGAQPGEGEMTVAMTQRTSLQLTGAK